MTDEYLNLAQVASYSKISIRQLTRFIARAADPLPVLRNGRRYLVRRSVFDTWLEHESRPKLVRKPLARGRSLREIAEEVKAEAHG
jgi:hypothetical protein